MKRYSGSLSYGEYVIAQIKRSNEKFGKRRGLEHWKNIFNIFDEYLFPEYNRMVCLGVRSGDEVYSFQKCFNDCGKSIKVYGTDINPNSFVRDLIYTYDFNKHPQDWENRFDITYSNSIDHAFNVVETLKEWSRITSNNGLIVVQFGNVSLDEPTKTDIYSYDSAGIKSLLSETKDIFDVLLFDDSGAGINVVLRNKKDR